MNEDQLKALQTKLQNNISDDLGILFDVYYRRDPMFIEDENLTVEQVQGPEFVHLMSVRVDLTNPEINSGEESIYYRCQGEIWSPQGEANPLIRGNGLHHTSMSIGDVVYNHLTGEWSRVAMCGFTPIK